jgi:hypothetical protein
MRQSPPRLMPAAVVLALAILAVGTLLRRPAPKPGPEHQTAAAPPLTIAGPAMLPLDLLGALWADLNRPTSEAEWDWCMQDWDRMTQAWDRGQRYEASWPTRVAAAYQRIRGHVLAARVKEGMARADVEAIFGAAEGQNGLLGTSQRYDPIGLYVFYQPGWARINGVGGSRAVVERVEPTPWSEIAALLLPDWSWRR